jgi:hypothetical protein
VIWGALQTVVDILLLEHLLFPTSLQLLSDDSIVPCRDLWLLSEFSWSWCPVSLWVPLGIVGHPVGPGCRAPLALLALGGTF